MLCDFKVVKDGDRWKYQCVRGCKPIYRDTKKSLGRTCWRTRLEPCKHLGGNTGQYAECTGCRSQKRRHALMGCKLHGQCLPIAVIDGQTSCQRCEDYDPPPPA